MDESGSDAKGGRTAPDSHVATSGRAKGGRSVPGSARAGLPWAEPGDQAELTRVQELVYELKIGQIMTSDVITVTPEHTMDQLKELMQANRISGAPVLQDGRLVGVVSIEDLIRALEVGDRHLPVGKMATSNVVTVHNDESVVEALDKFARYGYGRLPVLDRQGKLVGILTQGDVVWGLLHHMQIQCQAEEIHRYRASHIFEDIESDLTGLILRYKVAPKDFVRGGEASSKLKRALSRLGADPQVVRRVAIATYEAEMNLVIHADNGGDIVAEVVPTGIRITVSDSGPGIADVEQALQPGYSTAPDWIRELGFGAGMGLCNIKACADEMSLHSVLGSGTRLEMRFSFGKGGRP